MSGADAYFGEAMPMRSSRKTATHSMSGRRHKQPERGVELAEGGFLPFLPMIASALAPKAIGWAADKIFGKGAARPKNARLYGHELGFDSEMPTTKPVRRSVDMSLGMSGAGWEEEDADFMGSGTRKGMMRKTARKAYEGSAYTGGAKCGSAKPKKKPSARNLAVKRVMAERGCSLPEASRIVKQEGLA